MRFKRAEVDGVWLVDIEPRADARGFFARTWCAQEFRRVGLNCELAQCSISYNRHRGTLRGLHYQAAPYEEVKLVRCARGAIYDVVADLRPDSPTFLRWCSHELTAENQLAIYVPAGCAHGFQTLTDDAEVTYQMSVSFQPDAARAVSWNDPTLAIQWPAVERRIISSRDQSAPAALTALGMRGRTA